MKIFSPKQPFLQPFPRQNCIRTNIVIKKPEFCIIISKISANIPKNRAFFTTKSDEKCQKNQRNSVEIQRKNRQKNRQKNSSKNGQNRTNFRPKKSTKTTPLPHQKSALLSQKMSRLHHSIPSRHNTQKEATAQILLKIESKILGHFVLFFYICNTVLL